MKPIGQLVTSYKPNNNLTSNKLTSLEIKQRALMIAGDLASTEKPNDMTAWYCKAFRVLGEGRYTAICQAAKDESVKYPKKMFGWMLKQEMHRSSAR